LKRENWNEEFLRRFDERYEELKWLYCELYHNDMAGLTWLCNSMYIYYQERRQELKILDRQREKNSDWYQKNDLLGMMMYVNAFAGNIKGVQQKLDYIENCGVNYLHLMPLLESPKGKDDGGYAVSDFRRIQPELGTMEDLENLTAECHKRGICCCLDFVMNHTSEEHIWAKAARNGDPVARRRYFFYDDWDIPLQYEKTVPQVFPITAPGNFTWLDDCKQAVMTTFYPYQWDLNYGNCMVFNDMVGNMLYLINRGIDIIRLDAVPYIWKELGTSCRNLPQVHKLVRMMRLITEIVCPSVLLLGEVVMEPVKVLPYFGNIEKPECHMLYNVTTMASIWNTIATKDTSLLKYQMEQMCSLPKKDIFLNYLRCHDDIGWGLDYEWLKNFEWNEVAHKKYLNDYFTGKIPGSPARGELYNDDPRLGDARLCGTTASLCGLESALHEKNDEKLEQALACDLMLHAYLFVQSGIPVLYSGDEIGQLNDYSYKDDRNKQMDSRYLHRGIFPWKQQKSSKVAKRILAALKKMAAIRSQYAVFDSRADVKILETGNKHVLGVKRSIGTKVLHAYFNFSENPQSICGIIDNGYKDLLTGVDCEKLGTVISGYGYWWLYGDNF